MKLATCQHETEFVEPNPRNAQAFYTWIFAGTRFLAVPRGSEFHVCDSLGRNYGAWQSIATFRRRQRKRDALAAPLSEGQIAVQLFNLK